MTTSLINLDRGYGVRDHVALLAAACWFGAFPLELLAATQLLPGRNKAER